MYILRRKKKRDTKGETQRETERERERKREKKRERLKLSTLERIYFPISHKLLNKMPSIKQRMSTLKLCAKEIQVYLMTQNNTASCYSACLLWWFNKNGPHSSIGRGTTMRCDFVGVDVAFLKKVCHCWQVLTSASFRSRCKPLSSSPAHCVPS